jgi:site-specific DNA-methyltransferase (adenine-specific)
MYIFKNNAVATVMVGDCLAALSSMPDRSVNCCVTSPPYYGLRDYGVDGQIGLEDSPDAYVSRLVEVFREVRRVLTDDGTLWLNIGDSYNAHPGQRKTTDKAGKKQQSLRGSQSAPSRSVDGLKPKDLIGIPWLLAFALRADGWYLRQDIIWNKPNPMPESVTDRCTKAHEYIFLLSKSERYFFDNEAIKELATQAGKRISLGRKSFSKRQSAGAAVMPSGNALSAYYDVPETRNRRSVWTVTPKPYKGAHFAVYPPELIEPCVIAGCPEGGTILDPFGGSGTTGGVALKHGRNAVLCELNGDYAALMPARIEAIAC